MNRHPSWELPDGIDGVSDPFNDSHLEYLRRWMTGGGRMVRLMDQKPKSDLEIALGMALIAGQKGDPRSVLRTNESRQEIGQPEPREYWKKGPNHRLAVGHLPGRTGIGSYGEWLAALNEKTEGEFKQEKLSPITITFNPERLNDRRRIHWVENPDGEYKIIHDGSKSVLIGSLELGPGDSVVLPKLPNEEEINLGAKSKKKSQ